MPPNESGEARAPGGRARLEAGDIKPGEPLPLDVFDRSGMKLLGKGHVVRNLAQLERLLEIGLWGEAEAVAALRALTTGASQPESATPTFHQVSAFEELRAVRAELHPLLANWPDPAGTEAGASGVCVQAIVALAARLRHAVDIDPDAAIATLFWLRDGPYAARQATNTAVITELVLAHAKADESLRASAVMAALSMNLSIHALQDTAYEVKALTPEQLAEVSDHPRATHARLAAAGVDDPVWLQAILEHHEAADGTGYPAKLHSAATSVAGRALGIADRFCAVVSERAYRPAVPASTAMNKMFTRASRSLDPEMVVTLGRVLGTWPPGTVVMLRSAELAMVTRRTAEHDRPIARVLRTRDGIPSTVWPKRLTHRDTFAILEEIAHDRLPAGLDVPALWSPALETAPA